MSESTVGKVSTYCNRDCKSERNTLSWMDEDGVFWNDLTI